MMPEKFLFPEIEKPPKDVAKERVSERISELCKKFKRSFNNGYKLVLTHNSHPSQEIIFSYFVDDEGKERVENRVNPFDREKYPREIGEVISEANELAHLLLMSKEGVTKRKKTDSERKQKVLREESGRSFIDEIY